MDNQNYVTAVAEIDYLKRQLDDLSGKSIKSDLRISKLTRELEQRRQALIIISELHNEVTSNLSQDEIFKITIKAIQKSLKMDYTVIFVREENDIFKPVSWAGIDHEKASLFNNTSISIGDFFNLDKLGYVANKSVTENDLIRQIREKLCLPLFVVCPIIFQENIQGLLLTGRAREVNPFYPPLNDGDMNTVQSLCGFLDSSLMNKSLYSKQKKMTLSFERFVPLQFLQYLNRQQIEDVALGDQTQRDMTILFSDIRSYTSISEKMSPKENFEFINKYLEFMAPNILENHGFIDKFIGDAIMALFPLAADDALSAAIKLISSLKFFNEAWVQGGGDPINIGIGIHTGLLTLGTVGYKDRMETTVISDAVNLASRIEGLTKKYGCRILISGKTLESLSHINNIQLRQVDSVLVKGKHEPCDLFDVFDVEDMHSLNLKKGTLLDFNKAFAYYKKGFFSEAEKIFDRVLTLNPDDKAALILRNRCVNFVKIGVPKDWNGVVDYDYE